MIDEGMRRVEPFALGAIEAYLLDLDGTLADSEPWHKKTEVMAFERLGLTLSPQDLFPFTGMTLGQMLEGVRVRHGLAVGVDEFLQVQQPFFREIIRKEVELFPDADRFLRRKSGARLAMVTSSLPWYLEAVTAKHPILADAFELRICAADVESGKPHPEPFQTACARLGVPPERCLAVEDSLNGVRSAKAAGCRVAGVDRLGHGHLGEADLVIGSLDELE
jgi:HAD superfamily hydrolase (TIGR01509 family)